MNVAWTRVDVDGTAMHMLRSVPKQAESPAVILCMHAPGIDEFMEAMAQRLASAGFAAYVPDLYYRQGVSEDGPLERMGRLRDAELEVDLAATERHVANQGHRHIAVAGFCMGGRIALIAASVLPSLAAAVSFYGGFTRESWGEGKSVFERASMITCPVCLIGGADDTNPSNDDVLQLARELDIHGNAPKAVIYDGVGHAFLNPKRPGYREDVAMRAWTMFEEFLKTQLTGAQQA